MKWKMIKIKLNAILEVNLNSKFLSELQFPKILFTNQINIFERIRTENKNIILVTLCPRKNSKLMVLSRRKCFLRILCVLICFRSSLGCLCLEDIRKYSDYCIHQCNVNIACHVILHGIFFGWTSERKWLPPHNHGDNVIYLIFCRSAWRHFFFIHFSRR